MSDSIRKAIEYDEEHLGIELNPIDEETFRQTFTDYRNFVAYCNRNYGNDRPPENSDDYPRYLELKRNLARYFVHCKNETFRKVLLEQHPEFGDL